MAWIRPGDAVGAGADAAAHVYAERLDHSYSLAHVVRPQPPGEEERLINRLADPSAYAPVVSATCSAQLLDCERRVARIEQNGVDVRGYEGGLFD